jgi:hypothetical protein
MTLNLSKGQLARKTTGSPLAQVKNLEEPHGSDALTVADHRLHYTIIRPSKPIICCTEMPN